MKKILCFFCLTCFSFAAWSKELKNLSILTIPNPIHYQIEIADTPQKQKYGLMYRKSLPENHGMLFVFPKSQIIHMWMKNTIIPLDMIFIDQNNTIIQIQENTIPFSQEIISTTNPARKVLEINAGQVQKKHIKSGMKIRID